MTENKKKRPLDMTTDEAMEFLLGQEGAQKLKEAMREAHPPPDGDDNGSENTSKSARKQDNR
jgi:hypothetical protein